MGGTPEKGEVGGELELGIVNVRIQGYFKGLNTIECRILNFYLKHRLSKSNSNCMGIAQLHCS